MNANVDNKIDFYLCYFCVTVMVGIYSDVPVIVVDLMLFGVTSFC